MALHATSMGQVTIPQRTRELLNVQPGSAVEFEGIPTAGSPCARSDARLSRRAVSQASWRGHRAHADRGNHGVDPRRALMRGPGGHQRHLRVVPADIDESSSAWIPDRSYAASGTTPAARICRITRTVIPRAQWPGIQRSRWLVGRLAQQPQRAKRSEAAQPLPARASISSFSRLTKPPGSSS